MKKKRNISKFGKVFQFFSFTNPPCNYNVKFIIYNVHNIVYSNSLKQRRRKSALTKRDFNWLEFESLEYQDNSTNRIEDEGNDRETEETRERVQLPRLPSLFLVRRSAWRFNDIKRKWKKKKNVIYYIVSKDNRLLRSSYNFLEVDRIDKTTLNGINTESKE